MAFLKNYSNDIFLSYASHDNQDNNPWIKKFYERLNQQLTQVAGEPVKIWWDINNITNNEVFDDKIKSAISSTGILIIFLSNSFLKSTYCALEEEAFRKACITDLGLTINSKKRVFLVLLNEIPREKWPQICQGAKEYKMYEFANETDKFGIPIDFRSTKFTRKVAEINADIYAFMLEMNQLINSRKVFISKVCKKLENRREVVVQALTGLNIDVISEVLPPPPKQREESEQEIKNNLKNTILSVHLLNKMGDPYYPDDNNPEFSYVQLCAEIVKRENINHLIYFSEEHKMNGEEKSSDYINFSETIFNDTGSENIESYDDISEIIPKVVAKYKKLIKPKKEITRSIYLDYNKIDAQYAEILNNIFYDSNIKTYLSSSNPDNLDLMSNFEQKLGEAFGYVIIAGEVNTEWIENRLREVKKYMSKDKENILFRGIYLPPGKGDKNNSGLTPDLFIIDDGPNPKITPSSFNSYINKFNQMYLNATLGKN